MPYQEQRDNAGRSGPLVSYRVLEMGSTVAGPFCGRLLADFGADVIKIEPAGGDAVRTMGKRYKGKSLYAASILRNKSLISIDLRTPEGQVLVKTIVAKCDIVIENFRPEALEKWGLGYEDLAEINPGLIMVRISGFGPTLSGIRVRVTIGLGLGGAGIALDRFWEPNSETSMATKCQP